MPNKKSTRTIRPKTNQSSSELNKIEDSDDDSGQNFVPLSQVRRQKKPKKNSMEIVKDVKEDIELVPMSTIIYVGHLPRGFNEQQIKAFFKQFGPVEKVEVARNRKTGAVRQFAFVKFDDKAVAAAAVESMNGYLMFHKKLVCRHIPVARVKDSWFHNHIRKEQPNPNIALNIKKHKQNSSKKALSKALKREKDRKKKLADLGVEYKYKDLASDVKSLTSGSES
eukprot:TRINITY_DN13138_c0_g1_i1.p1 TRINITY_DN13138_c0_g1~~TRINITY_DN13138_c0_g1_i1.p1  ORF type:complete len:224 (+),score=52.01 TRINITY_DN13138_c0_g1_i1:53-724(+)